MITQPRLLRAAAWKVLAALIVLPAFWTAGVRAQENIDTRWMPWIGCWEPTADILESPLVCVVPNAQGAELVTVQQGSVRSRELLRTDGGRAEITREGCRGWERAEFSPDGRRVYVSSELTCEGGGSRTTSGLLSMASPTEWLDVRAVDLGDEPVALTQRYRLASKSRTEEAGYGDLVTDRGLAQRAARVAAARRLTVEDVQDAAEHVDAAAVEAWVARRHPRFSLDGKRLVELADAGVPSRVIDVMIAVTYPRRFTLGGGAAVAQADHDESRGTYGDRWVRGGYGAYFDPFWQLRYGYPFGYGYGYGYGGFGFTGYGFYPGYTPVVVDVGRATASHGRVVNGRGYRGRGSRGRSSPSAGRAPSIPAASGSPSRSGSSRGSSSGRKAKRRGGR